MSSAPLPPYGKPWLSYQDQVARLERRGIVVNDPAAAAEFLAHVNFYRFSGYCLAFEQTRRRVPAGLTFEQVRASYDFDRVLRDLVTEALEIAEVDMRAAIAYHFGSAYGAFGHTTEASFFPTFNHKEWKKKLRSEAKRSKEGFVTHFESRYSQFPDLPVWMATEVMSFGCLSKMYSGMHKDDKKHISHRYGLQPDTFESWMHHLVYVRNLCAHHSRLWNRVWAIKPELPYAAVWHPPHVPGNERLFSLLLILYALMRRCPSTAPFEVEWRDRVFSHLNNLPAVPDPLGCMGLTSDWQSHAVWK